MNEITVTRDTFATPAEVWAIMIDIEGSTETITGIDAIERLDDGAAFAPGMRWKETRTLFGKTATETLEITAVDEGRSYVVEADSGGTHYRSMMSVEPNGAGATITMTFGVESSGRLSRFMARTFGKAFEKATRKALDQDIADIATAAELSGAGA